MLDVMTAKKKNRVSAIVRRQASASSTRRYARSLPQFQPAPETPQMLDLLKRLTKAEKPPS